jgi:adenylate kinase
VVLAGGAAQLNEWLLEIRSLHIEHVSPDHLVSQEICRRSPLGQLAKSAQLRGIPVPAETQTALTRRWFMARKPDAGFALTGFPATLLQARVFDEWLEARDECLDAVLTPSPLEERHALADYYRQQGLLIDGFKSVEGLLASRL